MDCAWYTSQKRPSSSYQRRSPTQTWRSISSLPWVHMRSTLWCLRSRRRNCVKWYRPMVLWLHTTLGKRRCCQEREYQSLQDYCTMQVGVTHVAFVVYSMKDLEFMHNLDRVPISLDGNVSRRFDLGMDHPTKEIPFFGIDTSKNVCSLHRMCNDIGGGGGSIRYFIDPEGTPFTQCYCTIYPCLVHEAKMRFQAQYRYLPKTLKGAKSILKATRKLHGEINYLPENRVTGYREEIKVRTNAPLAKVT